jgi:phage tail sheath protein FI
MAERIVSPGVFTNELDQSFIAGGVAQIGAAIVGPTVKGPALVPTQITSFAQFQQIFGTTTTDSYVPYVVQDYLAKGGNVITVTRLLYEDGYYLTNGALAIIAKSGSGASAVQTVTHVLHPTAPVTTDGATGPLFEDSVLLDGGSGSFALKISGSYAAASDSAIGFDGSFAVAEGVAISASIVSTSNEYVPKVFARKANSTNHPVYVQYENINASSLFNNLGDVTMELAKLSNYEFLQDYATALTPWITSQKIGSSARNLFKFHTLSHGNSVNYDVKIGIRDVKLGSETPDPNGYGSFTVDIRRVNTSTPQPGLVNAIDSAQDTDGAPEIVETYLNVNLNPASPNYIARRIGTRFQTINNSNQLIISGDYPNISAYVRVEVDQSVESSLIDPSLVPFGFRAMNSPIPMASGSLNLRPISYATSQVVSGQYNPNNYLGFNFAVQNNLNYLAALPSSGSNTGSNSDFYLGDVSQDAAVNFPAGTAYSGSLQSALTAGTFTTNVAVTTRKFILPFQGGFDGAKPNLKKYSGANITATNTFGFNCSTGTSTGTVAYNKAFTLLSNTDYYDMNLLVVPGIIDNLHPNVTGLARTLCETRQDTFFVMDTNPLTDPIASVVNQVTSLDSNYTAAYWPWLKIPGANNVPTWVPPSTVIPGVLAFNDANQAPWYAPAGLNRGIITANDTYIRLSQSNRDTLYEARVNPIANFVNEGIVVFGQKTLQARPSALDRVNVRRLLIAVKKFIASSTRYLVFEQNTTSTRNRFLSIVNPYMEQVRANQGLFAFRVVMDQTNNTPDLIDQNILYGQIFLQPTRTAEFIILDFNIQPTGATFPGA